MTWLVWLVQDFGFLSVILRILQLTLQTLTVGGILFLVLVVPAITDLATRADVLGRSVRWIGRVAALLALTGILYVASDSAVLMGSAGLSLPDLITAGYFLAGSGTVLLAALIVLCTRRPSSPTIRTLLGLLALGLMLDTVFTSHAVSRLDHRILLSTLTLLHQGAAAAWLGGLAFFLIALRSPLVESTAARALLSRFTAIALTSVATLASSGIWLSLYFVGSMPALYGTAYGVMVVTKALMLLVLLAMAGANVLSSRRSETLGRASLSLLRRFSELELVTAFSIILLAASLTSQPPGVDLVEGRLTLPELAQQLHPHLPVLRPPPLDALSPATPLDEALNNPDDVERVRAHTEGAADVLWADFSHNTAGLFLVIIGTFAFIAAFPSGRWARLWPLAFIVMALFLMVFSDTENWPLGPIGYWQSFSDPEVLFHRVALSLLIVFAFFEAGVQTGRLGYRAALVFPTIVVIATCGFITHSHTLGNVRRELLIEISHTAIGIIGLLMGAFRLMEISLRADRERLSPAEDTSRLNLPIRIASLAWPVCMFAAGMILLNYREG
jgi:putative copper resistance protein D